MNQHLAKAKQYLTIAESGDAKREAYKAAAEEVAAYKADTHDTNENISVFLGRSEDAIAKLLRWRKSGYEADTPYTMTQEKTQESSTRSTTKRTLRDPVRRAKVLDELSVDERAAVAKAAMKQPEVMERVVADPKVREAAEDDEARRAHARMEAGRKGAEAAFKGTPLAAHFWRIVGSFQKWREGLKLIREEIDALHLDQYDQVLEEHRALLADVQANIDLFEARMAEPEDIIEGSARSGSRGRLSA